MRVYVVVIALAMLLGLSMISCDTEQSIVGSEATDPVIPRFTTETGWWIDATGSVSLDVLAELGTLSQRAESIGYQVAGAIFDNAASDPHEFAIRIGNANGMGHAETDNGLFVVVLLGKAGRDGNAPAVAIATGAGLEVILTDGRVGRALDEHFVGPRSEGEWEQGLINMIEAFVSFLADPDADEFRYLTEEEGISWWGWLIVLILIIIVLIVNMFSDGSGGSYSSGSSSRSSRSSNRSSSRSLGGGGSFKGGGASR